MNYPSTFLRPGSAIRRQISALLQQLRKDAEVGLHLGCGSTLLADVINCDLHNEAADRRLDSTDLAEFEDDSVDLVEHHHMIEHLSFEESDKGMSEWARVLKPGGRLVITCPDMDAVLRHWLTSRHGERFGYAIQMIYGSQEHSGMFHRSGYNLKFLAERLVRHGLDVEFTYAPYPRRQTPFFILIARKRG